MYPLALRIHRTTSVRVVLLFDVNEYIAKSHEIDPGIHTVYLGKKVATILTDHSRELRNSEEDSGKTWSIFSHSSERSRLNVLKKWIKSAPFYPFIREIRHKIHEKNIRDKDVARLHLEESEMLGIIRQEQPISVIVGGDRHLGYIPPLLSACQKMAIPAIIPPIAHCGSPDVIAFPRLNQKYYPTKAFSKQFPGNIHRETKTGNLVSFFPERTTKTLDAAGMLPPNPWILGGGMSSVLLVEGKEVQNRSTLYGVPSEKIRITGHYDHDLLFQGFGDRYSLRKKIFNEYDFNSRQPLLIVSLPQLWEEGTLDWESHWSVQSDLIRTIVETKWNVLISLHPRMNPENYAILESQHPLKISRKRLSSFLPAADIYVADRGSSTVFWAALCEIPTVAIDWWYKTNYDVYDWLHGKVTVTSPTGFHETLLDLVQNESHREALASHHRLQKHLIAPFDGCSGERIIDSILNPKRGTHRD